MILNFVPNQKPSKVDVNILRRQKLVRKIDEQIGFVRSITEGHDPRRTWFWMDETGTYFVPIMYGRHILELKKGMFSVKCQSVDEIEHILCTFRGMILSGELDENIKMASHEIRKKFKKLE